MQTASQLRQGAAKTVIPYADDDSINAFNLLGGERTMKRRVCSALDAHDLLVQGIPSQSLFHLIESVNMLGSGDALSKAIGISIRTLQRRKTDVTHRLLSTEQSSRAWRFAEIFARVVDILGSEKLAETWLQEPALGLDHRRPIDLLASSAGAEAVETYLTRLEYGVYV